MLLWILLLAGFTAKATARQTSREIVAFLNEVPKHQQTHINRDNPSDPKTTLVGQFLDRVSGFTSTHTHMLVTLKQV